MNKLIVIGTRGSDLALWQANHVKNQLKEIGLHTRIEIIKTKGDQIQNIGFDKMEGKGFFTKELEEALLNKSIDLAVHSCKDLESRNPDGLTIAAFSTRENPSDLLLIRKEAVDKKNKFHLKENALVGTSSNRRKALLNHFRCDCKTEDLRGNVPTRVQKLREGKYDAIILAAAGLSRLQLDISDFHTYVLEPELFVPAAAQGVLAIQCREEDKRLIAMIHKLNDDKQSVYSGIERKILNLMDGGCKKPLGIYCSKVKDEIHLHAAYAETLEQPVKRVFLRIDKNPDCNHIVDLLKQSKRNASVFVSRTKKEASYFAQTLPKHGYQLTYTSLTRFEKIPFKGIPDCEWIFFSSKNCVKFFFSQNPVIPQGVKIGSIGGATADALVKRGIDSHFTGSGPDTISIGKEFAALAGNSKVLFPQSTASYRTVQKQFMDQSNVIDLVVYDTIENEKAEVPDTDIVVLTSPSNAILYFRKKKVLPDQVFIPIGNSTAEILRKNGITNYVLPWNTSEIALADAIQSLG